jgi:hypothetical protein
VLLFTSFDLSELHAEQTSSVGVKHLKSYLEMAASGSEALEADPRRTAIFDRHPHDIANELRMRCPAVKTEVGPSGFRVDLRIASADAPDRRYSRRRLLEVASHVSRPRRPPHLGAEEPDALARARERLVPE